MLRLRHAAGYILFLIDDALCSQGGSSRESKWITTTSPPLWTGPLRLAPLISADLLSQVTEKLLEVENETMMKVADLEKLLLQKDKDLQLIRVSRRRDSPRPASHQRGVTLRGVRDQIQEAAAKLLL